MSAGHENHDIPEQVLEQAITWAVALGADGVEAAKRHAFEQWLQAHSLHRTAWQRLQLIESEFAGVRRCQSEGKRVLLDVVQHRKRRPGLGVSTAGLLILVLLLAIPYASRPQTSAGTPESGQLSQTPAAWSCAILRGMASLRPSVDGICQYPRACRG
ncbi:FecR/PupR family sigma factor regulator [Halopseudomonas pelagia]|uniref:FecR/PupR family sigma factor regulator n=1 Tax=Halopseudomonas pelagia TaxID=553151 RepID=UPI0003A5F093|nr:FecR/PupR family sigma factor regulator [Halopseudomonas pelagia]|tara:strand:- start:222282 stop:222755 length:474 start_codon:yes stop_codon:yes gene_type:complete